MPGRTEGPGLIWESGSLVWDGNTLAWEYIEAQSSTLGDVHTIRAERNEHRIRPDLRRQDRKLRRVA